MADRELEAVWQKMIADRDARIAELERERDRYRELRPGTNADAGYDEWRREGSDDV